MKLFYGMFAIFIAIGVVLAQDTATTSEPAKIAKREGVKVIKGLIVSADAAAGSVVIKSWQAVDTLIIDANTSITVGREKAIKVANLAADDRVIAYYKLKEGKRAAIKIIKIAAPPAATVPESGNN